MLSCSAEKAGDAALRRGVDSIAREIVKRTTYPLIYNENYIEGTTSALIGISPTGKIIFIDRCETRAFYFDQTIKDVIDNLPSVHDVLLIKHLRQKYIEMPIRFKVEGDKFHAIPTESVQKISKDTIYLNTFNIIGKSLREIKDSLERVAYEKLPPIINLRAFVDSFQLPENQHEIKIILKNHDSIALMDSLGNGKILLKSLPDTIGVELIYKTKNIIIKVPKWAFIHGSYMDYGVIDHYPRMVKLNAKLLRKKPYIRMEWKDVLNENESGFRLKHSPNLLFYLIIYPAGWNFPVWYLGNVYRKSSWTNVHMPREE
jgi:hypothetical protein